MNQLRRSWSEGAPGALAAMQSEFPREARRSHREKSCRSSPTQNDLVGAAGPGKCPLLVAKQFRSDERRRNRGAIYDNKRLASTLRTLMYRARNQFLPGTCFAPNQHRRVGRSDFHDVREDSFQGEEPTISSNMKT
jgi:hypothetical protein